MIHMVDISNWTTPYANYSFDWDDITGNPANYPPFRSGPFAGDSLGLGQDPDAPPPDFTVLRECNFVDGPAVDAVQQKLGVPVTGVFDQTTCAAWLSQYGAQPNAADLVAAYAPQVNGAPASCAASVVPTCPGMHPQRKASMATIALLGAGVGIAFVVLSKRRRRR